MMNMVQKTKLNYIITLLISKQFSGKKIWAISGDKW